MVVVGWVVITVVVWVACKYKENTEGRKARQDRFTAHQLNSSSIDLRAIATTAMYYHGSVVQVVHTMPPLYMANFTLLSELFLKLVCVDSLTQPKGVLKSMAS